MANIQVKIEYPIKDGTSFTFHAPCDCNAVDGITVKHPHGKQNFVFKDTHGNTLTGINNLFVEGSLVQVILDVTNGAAFLQNADTNGYLENRLAVERGRINELVALPTTVGAAPYVFEDEVLDVTAEITTSGAIAHIFVSISDLVLGEGESFNFVKIPAVFSPFDEQVTLTHSSFGEDVEVILFADAGAGVTMLTVENNGTATTISGTATATYSLASILIPEITDIRVGYDGKEYETAGEAVRGQIGDLHQAMNNLAPRLLPEGTEEDEGKVLALVNGTWVPAVVTGGGDGSSTQVDTTRLLPEVTNEDTYKILRVGMNGEGYEFIPLQEDAYMQTFVLPYLPPQVTEEDNGKFLRVVDGAWAAVTVQTAEEASF